MSEQPPSKPRVVVTGMGALTPLGIGVEESWQALCRGESGIRKVTGFEASNLRTQVAGQVRDFRPGDFMDNRYETRFDRFITLALAASRMAVWDSKLEITPGIADRAGVVIGNSLGGMIRLEENFQLVVQGRERRLSPFFVPGMLPSMASSLVATELGVRGPSLAVNAACASGSGAIGYGLRLIQSGEAKVVLTGGSEAAITRIMFAGYHSMKATTARNDPPETASRPFDRTRDGFVPAEGAGMLVLEDLQVALDRGARIYGEIAGYGSTCDAYHITSPEPGGTGAIACMTRALADANLPPSAVQYVNAHGTSTPLNDTVETKAIKAVFQECSRHLMVSSNKSMVGHSVGAAGAIEAIFSLCAIRDGVVPPTINYETPDPDGDLDYVPNTARKAQVDVVLSNSFGFGGMNASLVFRRFPG
jgi:3-oxoacyl-[acyl-carrier-protein] synthase II